MERNLDTVAVEHLAKGICTHSKRDVGLKVMRKLPLIRPGLGELLDHIPMLVKAYGKWPSYVYLFVMSLWTPLVVAAASWLAWKGWR
ncbi:hypothetical protein XI06_35185 [Bradyrhizobium sp. CCBAU 11434]|nr:hypothetical protein [Bradyrhizobium sp. CCBAU 11434]